MHASGPRLPALVATALAVALLSSLPALGQPEPGDEDGPPGCVEANPCDWIIAVDGSGLDMEDSVTEFTHMDWVVAVVVNHDDVEHTISLASHDLTLTIPSNDLDESDPFRINSPGTYTLSDQPTGDTVQITSIAEEEFDDGSEDSDGDGDENGTPGLAPLLGLAAFLAVAAIIRRRA